VTNLKVCSQKIVPIFSFFLAGTSPKGSGKTTARESFFRESFLREISHIEFLMHVLNLKVLPTFVLD
jgi:hypothetical protein